MKMLAFALASLRRRVWKNVSLFIIFSLLIFTVMSVFLIAASLKKELFVTLNALPDIYVQKVAAGRLAPIDMQRVEKIENISGIAWAMPRVWGYYYYAPAGVNFSVGGIDFDDVSYKESFNEAIANTEAEGNFMVVGEGVKRVLQNHYYKDFFNFITPQGDFIKVKLAGTFPAQSALEASDTILVPMQLARKIFALPKNEATDIVVKLQNPKEMRTIAAKLRTLYPDTRVITKEDLRTSYQNLFDYKSGLFLALFIGALFAFFILVFEKASSVGKEQIKEIGILKALGWRIEDVLFLKLLESLIVIGSSYLVGVIGSYFFVFALQAPLLRNLFSGFSALKPQADLMVVYEPSIAVSIFLILVPLYLAATIVPSWRAAVIDPEEAIR
ncbi:ABC transporter permease [Nitratiruptor tergarcus]|uniref:ABC-type transport system, involved in lipoprotein release, permease component n=1 Tax=Nitratiruptor tergarcus DSM 16512 TaxID=1069081 RepID=A0A1W1WSH3_9BACT|nr:FtsX-like permease family protein [Nitratiruptor tergarcus]SMC09155.1 ABC-type transport system, involved in lipoprotein release, permease component [Nitratiruptor tergarcus DSM 16512]